MVAMGMTLAMAATFALVQPYLHPQVHRGFLPVLRGALEVMDLLVFWSLLPGLSIHLGVFRDSYASNKPLWNMFLLLHVPGFLRKSRD